MIAKERVEAMLARVRPFVQAEGELTDPIVVAPISLDDRLRELEASLIGWALKVSGGNKSKAAKLLQIKRSTLGDRINRCGLGRAAGAVASHRAAPTEPVPHEA